MGERIVRKAIKMREEDRGYRTSPEMLPSRAERDVPPLEMAPTKECAYSPQLLMPYSWLSDLVVMSL